MSGFGTVYRKEVRENLRDRRSLFNSVLLGPILFPVLFIGLAYFAGSKQHLRAIFTRRSLVPPGSDPEAFFESQLSCAEGAVE